MNIPELFPVNDYEDTLKLSDMLHKRTFDCIFIVNNVEYIGWWSQSFVKFIVAEKQSVQFEPSQVSQYKRINTRYNIKNGEFPA